MEQTYLPADVESALQIGTRGWVQPPAVQDQTANGQRPCQPGVARQCLGDPHCSIDGRRGSLILVQREMCVGCTFEIVGDLGAGRPGGSLVNSCGRHVLCERGTILARLEQDFAQQAAAGTVGGGRWSRRPRRVVYQAPCDGERARLRSAAVAEPGLHLKLPQRDRGAVIEGCCLGGDRGRTLVGLVVASRVEQAAHLLEIRRLAPAGWRRPSVSQAAQDQRADDRWHPHASFTSHQLESRTAQAAGPRQLPPVLDGHILGTPTESVFGVREDPA